MTLAKRCTAVAAALALTASATCASAQIIVYDPTSYAKLLQEAQTALKQLTALETEVTQGRQLLTSLNQATEVNRIASALSAPALRAFLPDAQAFAAAAGGDISPLGAIGAAAQAIRSANRIYAPPAGDVAGGELSAAGDRAALALAAAEAVGEAGAGRLPGLETLAGAIDQATSARGVLDLNARLAAEQAMIANDQMRLSGLAMTEAAQEKLADQRERERAAAASAARLALYRSGFQ
jgi:type IV secretion system protein VirB5